VSPEFARAIDALVALLDALQRRMGTDELRPAAVVHQARTAYGAVRGGDRQALGAVLGAATEPTEK
jgi:hypothetical protein